MIVEPKNRISEDALRIWRIKGGIQSFFMLIVTAVAIILTVMLSWSIWLIPIVVGLFVLEVFGVVYLFPLLKWKRWRYEVREQEIELQHGIFILTRTLIPMIRVQHVDTKQGPLLRMYQLSTVMISTAATVHEIPALQLEEAEALRVSISRLARVADEDV